MAKSACNILQLQQKEIPKPNQWLQSEETKALTYPPTLDAFT
jgi:hypothetical protein